MSEAKVIRFNGRYFHCVGMWSEPWRELEIRGEVAWILNRHPEINFTPVRWRYVCPEGVIVAIPIGFFDGRGPERIPAQIREKTSWEQKWEDAPVEAWMKETKMRRPIGTKRLVVSEEMSAWANMIRRCSALSNQEAVELLGCIRSEAIYDEDRFPDYFIKVEVHDPLAGPLVDEVAMITRYNSDHSPARNIKQGAAQKPGIYGGDGKPILTEELPGFRQIEYKGTRIHLPPKAGMVVAYFVELFNESGTTSATTTKVLDKCGQGESILQAFKGYEKEYRLLIRKHKRTRDVFEFLPALDVVNTGKVVRPDGENSR